MHALYWHIDTRCIPYCSISFAALSIAFFCAALSCAFFILVGAMKQFLELIKRYIIPIILSIFFIVSVLFLVHLAYSFEHKIIYTDISADGVLSFLGAAVGCIVSVFITIYQVDRLTKERKEDKFERDANIKRPYFVISRVYYFVGKVEHDFSYNNHYECVTDKNIKFIIELKNIGEGAAINFESKHEYAYSESFCKEFKSIIIVAPDDKTLIPNLVNISKPCDKIEDCLSIHYENTVGCHYIQSINYIIDKHPVDIDESDSAEEYSYIIDLISNQSVLNDKEATKSEKIM